MLGDARLFTVGIGSAPNSHFMTKAAEFGHGTFTFIGDVREVGEKMAQLFARLESPVLTDIRVTWRGAAKVETWPSRVPDLYLGQPVDVSARLGDPAEQVAIAGRRGDEAWTTAMALSGGRRGEGTAVLWARRKVFAFLRRLARGDEIVVEAPDGRQHRYVVASTRIVDRHDVWIVADAGDTRLTLVTCYPFDTIRPGGPLRYVVVARSVDG